MLEEDQKFILAFCVVVLLFAFGIGVMMNTETSEEIEEANTAKIEIKNMIYNQMSTNSKVNRYLMISIPSRFIDYNDYIINQIEKELNDPFRRLKIVDVKEIKTNNIILYIVDRYPDKPRVKFDDGGEDALGALYFSIPFW